MPSTARGDIGQLIRKYRRNGFIFPSDSTRLGKELIRLLHSKETMSVADLHWYAWEAIRKGVESYEKGNDDSSGYFGNAMQQALGILERLADADKIPSADRKKILDQCLDFWLSGTPSNFAVELDHLVVKLADTNLRQQKVLAAVEEKLAASPITTGDLDWIQETWLLVKTRILGLLQGPEAARDFLYQFLDEHSCREEALQMAFEAGDMDEVKRLAEEGIELGTRRRSGFVSNWKSWLEKWAANTGHGELELDLMEEEFLRQPSKEQFQALKARIAPELFPRKVEIWYQKCGQSWMYKSMVAEIAVSEGHWDRLWNYLIHSHEFYGLRDYARYLPNTYRDDLIDLYATKLHQFIDEKTGRGMYRVAARQLEEMIRLGGLEQARQVAREAYERHPRRPSMQEEFERVIGRL